MVGVNFEVSALRADSYDEPDTPLEILVRHIDYIASLSKLAHQNWLRVLRQTWRS
jgi:microsomal dipeptidase-like Zn-dependent dipeptidase